MGKGDHVGLRPLFPEAGTIGAEVRVMTPGTCGEIVQGAIDGIPFHITCPIEEYSLAVARVIPGSGVELSHGGRRPKAERAARMAYEDAVDDGGSKGPYCIRLILRSRLPVGKGMASSTADISSCAGAVMAAIGRPVVPQRIARLALQIEPTDGCMFPGIVAFDHRQGKLLEPLGPAPPLEVIVYDTGTTVDTMAFNANYRWDVLSRREHDIRRAYEQAKDALRSGDVGALGEAAVLSARVNQEILYKPELEHMISLAQEVDAVGVNVAHSGGVIGLLFDRRRSDCRDLLAYLRRRSWPGTWSGVYRLTDGGIIVRTKGSNVHEFPA